MKKLAMLALGALAMIPGQAFAYDWVTGAKVTRIEATYAPGQLPLQIDQAAGNCAAGSWLYWLPQGADATAKAQNYQAILAVLMTAKSTGQQVIVFGSNTGCTVNYLYLS